MKCIITNTNIHIIDSYKESKHNFRAHIEAIIYSNPDREVCRKRNVTGCVLEWVCHNFCYNLNIARSHTKDVDLQIPRKWWEPIVYGVGGVLVWIFIK